MNAILRGDELTEQQIACYFMIDASLNDALHRALIQAKAAGHKVEPLQACLERAVSAYVDQLQLQSSVPSVTFLDVQDLSDEDRAYFDFPSIYSEEEVESLAKNLSFRLLSVVDPAMQSHARAQIEDLVRRHFQESRAHDFSAQEIADILDFLKDKEVSVDSLRLAQEAIENDILEGLTHNQSGDIELALDFIEKNSVQLEELVSIQRALESACDGPQLTAKINVALIPLDSPVRRVRDLLLRDMDGRREWDILKEMLLKRKGEGATRAPCECCGKTPHELGFSRNEFVEDWELTKHPEEGKGIQRLVGMKLICPLCSMLFHLDREFTGPRQRDIIEHVCHVNDFSLAQAHQFIRNLKSAQDSLNGLNWEVDVELLVSEFGFTRIPPIVRHIPALFIPEEEM